MVQMLPFRGRSLCSESILLQHVLLFFGCLFDHSEFGKTVGTVWKIKERKLIIIADSDILFYRYVHVRKTAGYGYIFIYRGGLPFLLILHMSFHIWGHVFNSTACAFDGEILSRTCLFSSQWWEMWMGNLNNL